MTGRLRFTFTAAVATLLATPSDVARAIGRSYRNLYDYRRGNRGIPIAAARALVAHLRKQARRIESVANALERAADVAERETR